MMPPLAGQSFLITGGSSGLGFATARLLEQAGGRVLTASRHAGPIGEHYSLDLADIGSIRSLADAIAEHPIDCVINNAGVLLPPPRIVHGADVHMGINFLGHFALTKFLYERAQPIRRFVHVTSMVSQFVSFSRSSGSTAGWRGYALSKLASLMFALELAQRDPSSIHIACHPGYTATNLQKNLALGKLGNLILGQTVERGAQPLFEAATSSLPTGAYIGPKKMYELRGAPERLTPYKSAMDEVARDRLWQFAEEQLDLQFGT